MADLGKIKSVTIVYEHGTLSLEGEAAEAWRQHVSGGDMLLHTRGWKLPEFEWKLTPAQGAPEQSGGSDSAVD